MSIIADDGWFTSWHRNYSEIDSIVITPHCCTSLYVVMLFESKIHMVADVVLIQHGNYECTLCTYLSQVQRMLFWFPRQFVMEQLYRVAGWWLVVYTTAISTQSISYTRYLWCYNGIAGARRCLSTCIRSASRPSKRFLFPFVFASNVFELTSHHVNQRRLFLVALVVNYTLVEIPTSWLLPGQ